MIFCTVIFIFLRIGTASSCVRFFEDCCTNYIPSELPQYSRYNSSEVFYTQPTIVANDDCNSAVVDCSYPGTENNGYFNLIYTNDKVELKSVKGSQPVFSRSCTENEDITYLSCEQGCTQSTCKIIRPTLRPHFPTRRPPLKG